MYIPLVNSIYRWLSFRSSKRILQSAENPFDTQKQVLFSLLERARKTQFGKQYGFGNITTIRQFQERVPIRDYEKLKPYIDRMRAGERNVLWPSETRWFAKSSGTTDSKSKFIPVSNQGLRENHFRAGRDMFTYFTKECPDTEIFKGKCLTLGGSHQIDHIGGDQAVGDLSAILIENMPAWSNFYRTPSREIVLIADFEEKLEKMIAEVVNENVTCFAGAPSWNLVMIKRILEVTGKDTLLDVWPNLELFIHGGVSFSPYREQYHKVIPSSSMRYMETYNASEGFFAFQDDLSRNDMMLLLDHGIFFEFVPMEQLDSDTPKAYTVAEIEPGKNYAIVISTNSGLWRYLVGDTVIFTSTFPHRVKISGRTRHFINAFGEEVIVDNADAAIKAACEKTGALVREYTAGPIFMTDTTKGAHEWLVEFETAPDDLELFVTVLDEKLCSVNSDYEAKRYKGITLDRPVVHVLKEGVFYSWLHSKGKLGGQNKIPRLFNSRDYVNELLDLNESM